VQLDTPRVNSGARGRVHKIYYISCPPEASSHSQYTFGFQVTPTGLQTVASDNIGSNKYPIALTKPSDAVKFYSKGEVIVEEYKKVIMAIPQISYDNNHVDVVGSYFGTSNQNDTGPYYNDGTDDPNNYWRRWSYRVSFKNDLPHKSYLFKVDLMKNYKIPDDCCIKKKILSPYIYKAYLWPLNIDGINDQASDDKKDLYVEAGNEGKKKIFINDDSRSIYLDWYASFLVDNASDAKEFDYNIGLVLYDQYGNRGTFTISAGEMPTTYKDKDKIAKWWMISDGSPGTGNIGDLQRNENNVSHKDTSFNRGQFYISTRSINKDIDYYLKIDSNYDWSYYKTKFKSGRTNEGNITILTIGQNDTHPNDSIYILASTYLEDSLSWKMAGHRYYKGDDDSFNGHAGIFVDTNKVTNDAFSCKITPVWETDEVLLYSVDRGLHYYVSSEAYPMWLYQYNRDDKRYRLALDPV